jgi:hypothetical protein
VAARFSAQNSPARKAAPGKPLLIVFLLCAGERKTPRRRIVLEPRGRRIKPKKNLNKKEIC